MASSENSEIAKRAFSEIRARFPQFQVIEDENMHVDLSITFPAQFGLKHKVNLNLQGDELHFCVSHFWLEWFPCTKLERVNDYIAAVCGFLSGEYRILEIYVGNKCIRAKLQSPENADWKTIGTSGTLWPLFPWTKKVSAIVRNL